MAIPKTKTRGRASKTRRRETALRIVETALKNTNHPNKPVMEAMKGNLRRKLGK
jgi:hypothetical protein